MEIAAAAPTVEELLARSPWARRLARQLTQDEDDAADLLQEAWLVAARGGRPEHVPWPSWLAGVLRILGLNKARDRARRRQRADELAREGDGNVGGAAPVVQPSPETIVEQAETQRILAQMVLELGEPYRTTLLLRYYEGLSAAEIARRTAAPAGTVRWRLKEGLDQLRAQLDRHWGSRNSWTLALAPLAGPASADAPPPSSSAPPTPSGPVPRAAALRWRATGLGVVAVVATGFLVSTANHRPAADSTSGLRPGPPHAEMKEPTMKRLIGAIAVSAVLNAHADARPSDPAVGIKIPQSSEARFQVPLGVGPILGPATAKVTILEFADYQCPFTAKAVDTMRELVAAYPNDVRFQVLHHPLPSHKHATLAAKAALAAARQGKFWEMHEALFARENPLEGIALDDVTNMTKKIQELRASGKNPFPGPRLERADLEANAKTLKLDVARFKADLDGPVVAGLMDIEEANVNSVRISGTPTFFVNGRMVGGSLPLADFKKIVDEEIAFADRVIKAGVKPTDLYNEITKQATSELPIQGSPGYQRILKTCIANGQLPVGLSGVHIFPNGGVMPPEGVTLSAEQNEIVNCIVRELRAKGMAGFMTL